METSVKQAPGADYPALVANVNLDAAAADDASTPVNPNPHPGDLPTPRSIYGRSAACLNVTSLLGVKIDSCPSSSHRTR